MSDSRDELEVEALVTDRYLDSLLAARERRQPAAGSPQALNPAVLVAATALEGELARVHPSFRFEERLATDLQIAAARQRRGWRPSRSATVRRLEPRTATASWADAVPEPPRGVPVPRPLLIGGALTSAALSIAGAYVAWRRGRPPVDPMVRAVRAAHRTGLVRSGLVRRIPARGSRAAGLAVPGPRNG